MAYFDENRKFFGLSGVLGRRDFIINCIIIEVIESLLVITPLFYVSVFNPDFKDVVLGNSRPFWYLLLQCVVGLASTGLYFPSVVRRVRDIVGEEDDNRIFLIASIISVIIFMGYTPVANSFIGGWIFLFTLLSLVFMAGKITSSKPKSEVIMFNWGAFLGTWIWGLINRIPQTFVILPLLFTPAWLPYMLICGMKGNEWAYEKNKKKFESTEVFHSIQKAQTTVLAVLAPVISLLTVGTISALLFFSMKLYSNSHPELKDNILTYAQELQLQNAEDWFEDVEEKDGSYYFYMDPEDWQDIVKSSFFKQSVLKNVVNYVLAKNGVKEYSAKSILENAEKLNRAKVYSEFNNEVLAEIKIDTVKAKEYLKDIDDKQKAKEIVEFIKNSYSFNQNPSIP